jgi:hypothetical protein
MSTEMGLLTVGHLRLAVPIDEGTAAQCVDYGDGSEALGAWSVVSW